MARSRRRRRRPGAAARVAGALLAALAAAVVAATLVSAPTGAAPSRPAAPTLARAYVDTTAYEGLGAWLDVFDTDLRRDATKTVARLVQRGVSTVFLETSSWSRPYDLQTPDLTGAFLDTAHAAGLRVVAWYLPGFQNAALDTRRSLAAIRFRSAGGGAFDSFALDIEDATVRDVKARTRRLLALVARVRAAAPGPYALGAIVPSPLGMLLKPDYWPGFPWQRLAATMDVFVPMAYSSYRSLGADGAFAYAVANVALVRALAGNPTVPVHVVGGLAGALTAADVAGFVRGALQQEAVGASLYDAATTRAALWPPLAPIARLGAS